MLGSARKNGATHPHTSARKFEASLTNSPLPLDLPRISRYSFRPRAFGQALYQRAELPAPALQITTGAPSAEPSRRGSPRAAMTSCAASARPVES